MALTKQVSVDQITVIKDGTVLVREVTTIMEDGNELSKQYHRTSFAPKSDLTSVPANVAAICNLIWTPEVIAAYKAQLEANNPVAE